MKLYYDPADGRALFTLAVPDDQAPPGVWVEIDDTLHPLDVSAHCVVEGMLVPVENLVAARLDAVTAINEAVGAKRQNFITEIPGQQMIYQAKEAEARAYVALDPEPANLEPFPLISAEIGITAPTARELAQVWLHMGDMWRATAATLEGIRLTAIGAVGNAGSTAEIDLAVATCFSALEAA
ncbi:hypothetical protein [Ponticoccus litoralis]|uniref:DUF2283 domain-containing protein n=1 Tax=Ponticoccus litoralis TaxID=422297 RepID=A0AAW9SHP1_9RHOB